MPTAKKTSSGMWRVRAYSHTDAEGKKHYRSFSAPTKQEAEQAAAKFSGTSDRMERVDLTVSEAIEGYINAKEGVLSPSTVRGYRRMLRNNFDRIGHLKIRKLTTAIVQTFVSDLSKEMSAKSVKNVYGLLTAGIALYMPDKSFKVKLPTRPKKRLQAISDDSVMVLYNSAPRWLKICIGLAAFGGLRRGEISALKYGDISDGIVHVHADMIQDSSGAYHYKEMPKTLDSVRYVPLPADLVDLIGTGDHEDFIIDRYTGSITAQFEALRDKCGVDLRFHDLRHFFASTGAFLIPRLYLAHVGGWANSSKCMEDYYEHEIDGKSLQYAKVMTDHFSDMISKSMTQRMTQENENPQSTMD